MRIDSHHHVWDLAVRNQDWLAGEVMAPISRTFVMTDMEPELNRSHIDYTVLVQTQPLLDETPEFLDIAREHPKVAAVVGWLDMGEDDVTEALEGHLAHPEANRLVSIRDMVQGKEDPRWLAQDQVVRNLQRLGERGIAYDLLTIPPQLPAAIDAVRGAPDTRFVLDHISKPNIAQGQFDDWAQDMRELAKLPNVWVKISGMVTEAKWDDWSVETFRPYVEWCAEQFGPERLMFGSDWPVCLLGAQYHDVVDIVEQLTSSWSDAEQAAFWSGAAIDAYRLEGLLD